MELAGFTCPVYFPLSLLPDGKRIDAIRDLANEREVDGSHGDNDTRSLLFDQVTLDWRRTGTV